MGVLTPLEQHKHRMRAFTKHPHIQPLGKRAAWTISTKDKMPIDMYMLETRGSVFGCNRALPLSTKTLDEVASLVPDAANFAFYLEASKDGVCVLDIEPDCPDNLKAQFLKAPCLYIEKSMSGKGFHMLLEYPYEFMENHPVAALKTVMKDKPRGFEFLFEHWVTFTGRQVMQPDVDPNSDIIIRELTLLADKQTEMAMAEIHIDTSIPEEIPYLDELNSAVGPGLGRIQTRTLAQFDNDRSRYEFSIICSLLNSVRNAQQTVAEHRHMLPENIWDDQLTAYTVYRFAQDTLTHRPKHDEFRCGLPFLLYLVQKAMSLNTPEKSPDETLDEPEPVDDAPEA